MWSRSCHDQRVFFTYVDESFNRDRFDLGALLVSPEAARDLSKALDEVAKKAQRSYGMASTPELHGYEIFHAEGEWSPLKPLVRARVGLFDEIIDLICKHNLALLVQPISKHGLHARYGTRAKPREQVAWEFLLQQIDDWAKGETFGSGAPTVTLVIADQIDEHEERRRDLEQFRASGTSSSYKRTNLDTLIDTLHFAPSHHSRLIQAIDCALFVVHRHETVKAGDPRSLAAVGRWYDLLYSSGNLRSKMVWPA